MSAMLNHSIVLASHNAGKLAEFSKIFEPLNWQVYPQSHWNIAECPEPHTTFIENALAKARHAATHSGLPSLADDSGLCVQSLNNAPGVYSARYADSHSMDISASDANNTKLLFELNAIDANESIDRQAYFICVLVAIKTPQDPEPLIATGRWHGHIAQTLNGHNGFGYDPLFICAATQQCAATLTMDEKSALSHRGKAMQQMLQLINTVW
ncbi:MAG: RdgB/HAM1 family non-canonical purine pyrophosphatase [Pseudomonadota bacterium]|jgi:XTP/dITP diphosphohydrolase